MNLLDQLNQDGIVVLPQRLTSHQIACVTNYLSNFDILVGGHVARIGGQRVPHPLFLKSPGSFEHNGLACYELSTIVLAPFIIETALGYLDFIESYLGGPAVMYSVNAFWSLKSAGPRVETQIFHRDNDDEKFLALFTYLTDVDETCAHKFVAASHRGYAGAIIEVKGPAGTIFIEDGRGLHKAECQNEKPRLMSWVRFGVSAPPGVYGFDRLQKISSPLYFRLSEREREVCRFIVGE